MPNEKHYTLKSKDIPLVDFIYSQDWSVLRKRIVKTWRINIEKIYTGNINLWPKGLNFTEDKAILAEILMQWLKSRKAPAGRAFINKVFEAIGNSSDPLRYIHITHAMSLNDTYWVDEKGSRLKWKDCNLYSHPFSEIIANLAFSGGAVVSLQGHLSSPEFTTGGALRKCWVNQKDGIYLRKAEDPQFVPKDGRTQISMEFFASQVAEEFGLPHISYQLKEFEHNNGVKEIICECPLFTTEDTGYVDASAFFKDKGLQLSYQDLFLAETHIKMADIFGYNSYADMMLFDSLILNVDRHLGNFGYMVDNNSGEYLMPAPLFDNGFSLLVGAAQADLEDPDSLLRSASCQNGRYLAFDEQVNLFVDERHIPKLERFTHFEFEQPKGVFGVSDATLQVINYAVRFRSKRALEIWKSIKDMMPDSQER